MLLARSVAVVLAAVCSPFSAAQLPLSETVRRFAPHDLDGDGRAEVLALDVIAETGASAAKVAFVLVEARLLQPVAEAPGAADGLRKHLRRYADDLAAEGYRALVVAATVHAGPPHQDGRTLLALRRLLAKCHAATPLAGVLLVGHFPDALLVRTCNWHRNDALTLPGRDGQPVAIDAKTVNVCSAPEYVAHRCDVVLADLDGAWESVYVAGPATLPSSRAVFGDAVPPGGGACVAMSVGELAVTDVFHVRDGTACADRDAFTVALDANDRDHECTDADRAFGNPLARPEIAVSRLDAHGVARVPEPRALGADGKPQAVALADGDGAQGVGWRHDQALELRLLGEYFDRNHRFRTSPLPPAQRKPASIAWGLPSGMQCVRSADAAWQQFAEDGYDEHAASDLVAYVRWLQRPAVLRTLRAHSDPWAAEFRRTEPAALAAAAGGPAWTWRREEHQLVPTFAGHANGRADFWFYRSLWENRVLPDFPYLLVHTGCEALSPPGSVHLPYDEPTYGAHAHAESLLFFTPCLAIVGRAKVFYDEPRGFAEALGEGATFGDAWRRYFTVEGAAPTWGEVGDDIGRKRAYFWSVVGDWSLRLPR